MPAPRILFVKLSSLGDVVHNLPAVSDLAAHLPGAHIAWAVEDAYVDLVRLHPAVNEALAVSLRSLRRNALRPAEWARTASSRRAVRSGGWDYVIDTQGLLKSATVARWAGGPRFGLDRSSAREGVAARFYDVKIAVAKQMHAVERNRALVAEVFGYALRSPARYGIATPPEPLPWLHAQRYAVLLHAASRTQKRWPEERWIALGRLLAEHGYAAVFPGGTDEELGRAARLAHEVPHGIAAPRMNLREAAALLGNAAGVVGVDTGLTHLAVALGVPTVGIYCATRPELTGLHGDNAVNVGGAGPVPSVDAVAEAVARGSAGA
jgi:heptosyltransferase-1